MCVCVCMLSERDSKYVECERLQDKTRTHARESACEGVCRKERTCARKREWSRQGATVALACVHVYINIHIYIYTCHAKVASKIGMRHMLSATNVVPRHLSKRRLLRVLVGHTLHICINIYIYICAHIHILRCTYTHVYIYIYTYLYPSVYFVVYREGHLERCFWERERVCVRERERASPRVLAGQVPRIYIYIYTYLLKYVPTNIYISKYPSIHFVVYRGGGWKRCGLPPILDGHTLQIYIYFYTNISLYTHTYPHIQLYPSVKCVVYREGRWKRCCLRVLVGNALLRPNAVRIPVRVCTNTYSCSYTHMYLCMYIYSICMYVHIHMCLWMYVDICIIRM